MTASDEKVPEKLDGVSAIHPIGDYLLKRHSQLQPSANEYLRLLYNYKRMVDPVGNYLLRRRRVDPVGNYLIKKMTGRQPHGY